jgi:hypothetical protein
MSKDDKKILKNFNFYIKLVDIEKVEEVAVENKVFKINKSNKKSEELANNSFSYSFPTTNQDEKFEENSEVSSLIKYYLNNYNLNNNFNLNRQIPNNNNKAGFVFSNMYNTYYLTSNNKLIESYSPNNINFNFNCNKSSNDFAFIDLNEIYNNNNIIINFLRKNFNAESFNQEDYKFFNSIRENFNKINDQLK